MSRIRFKYALLVSLIFIAVLWLVKFWQISFDLQLYKYGILPRTFVGLRGIIFAPFIHGNFKHLYSNSLPLFFLLFALFYFYPKQAYKVMLIGWIATGTLVWLIGREAYHIGASGLVYMLVSFGVFAGIFSRKKSLLALSLVVIFFYGSSIWGMFPSFAYDRSWESHASGYLVGFVLALIFSRDKKTPISNSEKEFIIFKSDADSSIDFDYDYREDF